MEKYILIGIIFVVYCFWAWYVARHTSYGKYILYTGICLLIFVITSFIGNSSHDVTLNGILAIISIIAFIGSVYFLIKGIIAQCKSKNESSKE